MRERRQRHDDAHFPLQGRGKLAWRGRVSSNGALLVQRAPVKAIAPYIPPTPWQLLMYVARKKRETLLMLGLGRVVARREAIDDLAEQRLRAQMSTCAEVK